MKILNLYAGIGGNRKLWGDSHEITAVELNPEIAKIYQDFFPNDTVIVADAHQYLLDHYKEFDFVWGSPPCPSHSRIRIYSSVARGQNDAIYPDMTLYQEIILLKHYFKGKWVIENVIPFYKTLIPATVELHRHLFWSNFHIQNIKIKDDRKHDDIKSDSIVYGFDISSKDVNNKTKCLRNMVNPEVAKYILDIATNHQEPIQEGLFDSPKHKPNN